MVETHNWKKNMYMYIFWNPKKMMPRKSTELQNSKGRDAYNCFYWKYLLIVAVYQYEAYKRFSFPELVSATLNPKPKQEQNI